MKASFARHGEQIVGNLPKLPGYSVEDPTTRAYVYLAFLILVVFYALFMIKIKHFDLEFI